jgi:hypothetical protein
VVRADTLRSVRARGLSLWLVLDDAALMPLRALIASLAERLGTSAFEPHVTLLGGLEHREADVTERAQRLASSVGPLSVPVVGVGARDEYFRCLFLELAQDPALLALRERGCLVFERAGAFLPHLSLVYADLAEAPRGRLRAELATAAPPWLRLGSLLVVSTEGEVACWRPLRGFPLSGGV